jgi:hypothetical protein
VGAELYLGDGMSLSGRFEGEFAPGFVNYGGIGALRVNW